MRQDCNRDIFAEEIADLEARMKRAEPYKRDHLRADVQEMICKLIGNGDTVPRRLRDMNRTLEDEAFEDIFENMPV
ncbi:hypothetical protein ABMC89_12935 [Sulfitobacter sp. HNIBRBA3233]|uniref:hypothetical protein n=1 Tax=Sulfitobacter marinivivus TaxID=3158558 RepID=UPI0032DEEC0D